MIGRRIMITATIFESVTKVRLHYFDYRTELTILLLWLMEIVLVYR